VAIRQQCKICPNCGEPCATTFVICRRCGHIYYRRWVGEDIWSLLVDIALVFSIALVITLVISLPSLLSRR